MKQQNILSNSLSNRVGRLVGIAALSLLSVPFVLHTVQAQTTPTSAEVGFEFEGFRELNAAAVVSTEYIGECPGNRNGSVGARFLSATRPPGPGLRVVIRNITRGMGGDTTPYTDREYDKGRLSEGLFISPATRHHGRYLAVLEGANDFTYDIKRGEQVIESGSFSADIDVRTRTVERSATISYQEYCIKDVSLNDCKKRDIRTRVVRNCPTT